MRSTLLLVLILSCLNGSLSGCAPESSEERRAWHHDRPRHYDDWIGPDDRCRINRWGDLRCHRRYFPG
ncbi:MAG: hypothetical protein AAF530_06290 [Pseudomonadota bacterium]